MVRITSSLNVNTSRISEAKIKLNKTKKKKGNEKKTRTKEMASKVDCFSYVNVKHISGTFCPSPGAKDAFFNYTHPLFVLSTSH